MKTILIVEDNDGIRTSLKTLLTRKGYNVIDWPTTTGAEKLIKQTKPDFVLTDHNLGPNEEAGYSLAMRLKNKGIKVLLMSADEEIGLAARKNDLPYIRKPFSVDALFNMLSKVANV